MPKAKIAIQSTLDYNIPVKDIRSHRGRIKFSYSVFDLLVYS